jgi:hypothetical protein
MYSVKKIVQVIKSITAREVFQRKRSADPTSCVMALP